MIEGDPIPVIRDLESRGVGSKTIARMLGVSYSCCLARVSSSRPNPNPLGRSDSFLVGLDEAFPVCNQQDRG